MGTTGSSKTARTVLHSRVGVCALTGCWALFSCSLVVEPTRGTTAPCRDAGGTTCLIADSSADFSDVQGEGGWWYGYYDSASDGDQRYDPTSDFQLMVVAQPEQWKPPGLPADQAAPGWRWTSLSRHGAHPDPGQWAIRRWTSPYAGRFSVELQLSKRETKGGDGVLGRLTISGTTRWSGLVSDGVPQVSQRVTDNFAIGTEVELVLDSRVTSLYDGIGARMTIFREP